LLPQRLATVNPRTGTPVLMTMVTAVVVAAIAAFLPLRDIASLANAGTLVAFIAVAVCMLVLMRRNPSRPRIFGPGATWVISVVAIVGCIYLFTSLQTKTIVYFFIWSAAGVAVYFLYAQRKSLLGTTAQ
jgi:basic amino acid/polyamine antiporter, APA family